MGHRENQTRGQTASATQPLDTARHARPAVFRDVAIFVAAAFGLGWLVCLPLWIGSPRYGASFYWGLPPNAVLMLTPA